MSLERIINEASKIAEGLERENRRLRAELGQCQTELEEAAKLLAEHFPATASIYRAAATRVASSLES